MNTEFDLVDLGTKKGNAIYEFLSRAGASLSGSLPPLPIRDLVKSKCVGYERKQGEVYRKEVESRGYKFRIANLATEDAIAALPTAKVYLAWHFLEHVPNKDWSDKLVKASLTNASWVAWFRLPSFQQDFQTGEGVLREHGMRFTWTNWRGHPSHWLVEDCTKSILEWSKGKPDREFDLVVKPAGYIKSMNDHRVVPIDTPIDVNEYKPHHGKRPLDVKFKRPIIAEWEVIVRFKDANK